MLEPIYRFATIYGIVHNFMGMGFRAAISNEGYPVWTHVGAHGLGAQLLPAKIQATMAIQLHCTLRIMNGLAGSYSPYKGLSDVNLW